MGAWPDARIWEELQLMACWLDGWSLPRRADPREGHHPDALVRRRADAPAAACSSPATLRTSSPPPTGARACEPRRQTTSAVLAEGLGVRSSRTGEARTGLDEYSERALRRIWRAEHFSKWMTSMLHVDPRRRRVRSSSSQRSRARVRLQLDRGGDLARRELRRNAAALTPATRP